MQAAWQGSVSFFRAKEKDYMMRSEKRPVYQSNKSGKKKKKKKQQKRAGAGYVFLTMVLLLLVWPIGLILFWRRKVRGSVGAKVLVSLVTLVLGIMLYAALLNAPFTNPRLKELQDKANGALTEVYDGAIAAMDDVAVRYEGCGDTVDAFWRAVLTRIADEIDAGVDRAATAREAMLDLTSAVRERGTGILQEAGFLPTPEPGAEPSPTPKPSPTPRPTAKPTATPRPTASPTPTPTAEDDAPEATDAVIPGDSAPQTTPAPMPGKKQ